VCERKHLQFALLPTVRMALTVDLQGMAWWNEINAVSRDGVNPFYTSWHIINL